MITKPIYEVLIENLDKIKVAGYLRGILREYNLHNLFSPVYESNDKIEDANFLVVFIILSYSNKCSWLRDMSKDRRTLKLEIINSILIDSKIEVSDEIEILALKGNSEMFTRVLDLYIHSQKNRDFASLMAKMEHVSACNRQSHNRIEVKDSDLKSRTDTLSKLEEIELQIKEIQARIEREYLTLDEALKKEDKKPISKDIDITVYENWLYRELRID